MILDEKSALKKDGQKVKNTKYIITFSFIIIKLYN